jgi:hypothetical protein
VVGGGEGGGGAGGESGQGKGKGKGLVELEGGGGMVLGGQGGGLGVLRAFERASWRGEMGMGQLCDSVNWNRNVAVHML